ncbi:DUF6644 family protein [Noviherbaspirillum aerium]|uniref:DUF6644 family protein n=1 Tax=Noviherbaspirillum aerium TaxID=2588497 RepID=UPI00124C261C|nr:DUF6644 family protein [Noviherbaspirillum aerium]
MQPMGGSFGWLEATALGSGMRSSLWMYPIVEIFHIVGFVFLVGAVFMFDLRLLGLSKNLPVTAMARHLLRWSVLGLFLVVPAGLMMFSAHPGDFISNRVFQLKLLLILAAGINAAIFHTGVYQTVDGWNTQASAPSLARFHAALSMALWIAVIACGRLLAYT